MLAHALQYASRGRRVLPIWWLGPDGACACGGSSTCNPGKHPIAQLAPRGVHSATSDLEMIERWWSAYPLANLGMLMGSGIVAIDVDPRHGGNITWSRLQAENDELPWTPHARTGGGGDHFFVCVDGTLRTTKLEGGIELIGDGGYVLAAPSRTEGRYGWIVAPWDTEPAWMPGWLHRLAAKPPGVMPSPIAPPTDGVARLLVRARAYLAKKDPAISGSGGHDKTFQAALDLVRGFGLPVDEALRLLLEDYNPRCRPPWSLRELRHKVESAARSEAPHWLANSPGTPRKGLASGGADPWLGAVHAIVHRALFEPPPVGGRSTAYRVRLECLTSDGEVLPRQYVVLPLAGHEATARAVYDATLGDIPPAAWLGREPEDSQRPDSLERRLVGREIELIMSGGPRATRIRRAR